MQINPLRLVENMNLSVIVVFDAATTGHTLRWLPFPSAIEKIVNEIWRLENQVSPMLTQVRKKISAGKRTIFIARNDFFNVWIG